MTSIAYVTIEAADPAAAQRFHTALGVDSHVRARASQEPTAGFRGFTLSLTVAQPSVVDAYFAAGVEAGAEILKPAAKSFWGYGGVLRAPDGTIWKIATSTKKNAGTAPRRFEDIVLLLGAGDVLASKRFYVGRGLTVGKSFGRKYVEFETPEGAGGAGPAPVKLALYGRRALAKDAGVPEDGSGSHRLVLGADAGSFADPDGFAWEPAEVTSPAAS
ncbi:glyoxalase [Streptomyces sp. NPDC090306]|uniref:glyoxalase n=1 Tax=unclassified Streptomyces TaxID=2593676 RepID=UPI0036E49994